MGYKKSFNLVTLQLIIPLSTMTKEEYKNAYGIDLDDIDIERVTLLQEDGSKNKYFVDEIKTTESGINIYAGGNILSIGESSVSVTENAYSIENAKPLYWHGLNVQNDSAGNTYTFSLIIISNDETPIDTWAKLKAKLIAFGASALIALNGFYNVDSANICNLMYLYVSNTSFVLVGNASDCSRTNLSKTYDSWDSVFGTSVIEDRVNKIN